MILRHLVKNIALSARTEDIFPSIMAGAYYQCAKFGAAGDRECFSQNYKHFELGPTPQPE